MSKHNINYIIEKSVPDFIKSEYPLFVHFLSAYYEWLYNKNNSEINSMDINKNFIEYHDVDTTLDEFISHFENQFLVNIPKDILADKRLLVKNIKNFYLSKGTQESYKFLFRLLYNEDVEFYYPKDDILRASDGNWYVQKTIKFEITSPLEIIKIQDINNVLSGYVYCKDITETTDIGTAVVESAISYTDRGKLICELTLSNIVGVFEENRKISFSLPNTYLNNSIILETYNEVVINDGGSGYKSGDVFYIKDTNTNTVIGQGLVTYVTKGKVLNINVVDAGSGYDGDIREIQLFENLPFSHNFLGTVIENQLASFFESYTFGSSVPLQFVDGTGDEVKISDTLESSGYGATAFVKRVNDNGEILEIDVVNQGDLYEYPTAEVLSDTGSGAIISVVGGGGRIKTAKLDIFPIKLQTDTTNINVDMSPIGDGNALLSLLTGGLITYQGKYLNEDGQLSSTKRLQDNLYYQDFSYVLKTKLPVDKWKDVITKIIHPTGFALFGEVKNISINFLNVLSNTNYNINKDITNSGLILTNPETIITIS